MHITLKKGVIWYSILNLTLDWKYYVFHVFCAKKHFSAWKHVIFMFYQVLCKKRQNTCKIYIFPWIHVIFAHFVQKGEKRRKNKVFAKKTTFLHENTLFSCFTKFCLKKGKYVQNLHFSLKTRYFSTFCAKRRET